MSSVSAVNSLLSSTAPTAAPVDISSILAASAGTSAPGIDVTSAVAAAIYADRAPERIWQADQATLTSQTTTLTAIQTATAAIATDMEALNTLTGPLSARTVTSSSSDVTATAAEGTVLGDHTVVVNSLAAAGSWYSSLEPSAIAPLAAGSFTLSTAAGPSAIFQTGSGTSGDTLADLATAINSYTSPTGASLGVTATVVSDSTGSRLAIISNSAGAAADFSVAEPFTSWTAPEMSTGETLGANSLTLTSAAGIATIATTNGETYATLAAAINNATITTSFGSAQTSLAGATALTAGSVTTIQDPATGQTMTYTAASGSTIADLNTAIAAAVTAGTLSPSVTGTIIGGQEVISEGSTDQGITVSSNDSVLGAMDATPGTTTPLGLTATPSGPDANGNTNLTIASTDGTTPFTINEPSSSGTSFQFTQAVVGADASLTVDGVPIDSASNTVNGAIPGVTLTLLGTTSGSEVALAIGSDSAQVSTAINQFVTDYNTAIGLVNTQFTFNSATGTEGALASDPTVVSLQSTLEQALNYVNTPATGTTTVSTLNDLGISAGTDGALAVDSTTLDNALTNNPIDVQNFFEGAALNGFANSLSNTLNSYTDPANGAFTVDLSGIGTTSANLTSQINDFETNYIANQQTVLTAMYSSAEIALQQLPQKMAELNSELGFTGSGSSSG